MKELKLFTFQMISNLSMRYEEQMGSRVWVKIRKQKKESNEEIHKRWQRKTKTKLRFNNMSSQ